MATLPSAPYNSSTSCADASPLFRASLPPPTPTPSLSPAATAAMDFKWKVVPPPRQTPLSSSTWPLQATSTPSALLSSPAATSKTTAPHLQESRWSTKHSCSVSSRTKIPSASASSASASASPIRSSASPGTSSPAPWAKTSGPSFTVLSRSPSPPIRHSRATLSWSARPPPRRASPPPSAARFIHSIPR